MGPCGRVRNKGIIESQGKKDGFDDVEEVHEGV